MAIGEVTFVTEEFSGAKVELLAVRPALDGSMLGLLFQFDGREDVRLAVPHNLLTHLAEALLRGVTETQENFDRQHRSE